MNVVNFTPVEALLGGVMIGLAAALLWLTHGRLAGVSNILGQALLFTRNEARWQWAFLAGLLAAGCAISAWTSAPLPFALDASYFQIAVAGLLVGYGTRLGTGCTSGHGVCGVARMSPRSIVATLCFVGAGMVVVALVRWMGLS